MSYVIFAASIMARRFTSKICVKMTFPLSKMFSANRRTLSALEYMETKHPVSVLLKMNMNDNSIFVYCEITNGKLFDKFQVEKEISL